MLRGLLPGWLAPSQAQENTPNSAETHDAEVEDNFGRENDDNTSDGGSTPKAKTQDQTSDVPTFTLDSDYDDIHGDQEPAAPSFPAPNSAQRASATVATHSPASKPGVGLMLPPARPVPSPRNSAVASLRVPSTGPIPNRGPPLNSQQRVSGGLAPNSAVKTSNPRGKVLLSPGHSPMDWAALTKKGNLGGVSGFQRVTPSQLQKMTGRKGKPAWSVWQGKVYNITPYLPFHPGGEAELMKAAGRNGTKLFLDVHPWVNWENMLESCLVGVMVPEDYERSSLEDMD